MDIFSRFDELVVADEEPLSVPILGICLDNPVILEVVVDQILHIFAERCLVGFYYCVSLPVGLLLLGDPLFNCSDGQADFMQQDVAKFSLGQFIGIRLPL